MTAQEDALDAGADLFLHKPLRLADLLDTLSNLLAENPVE